MKYQNIHCKHPILIFNRAISDYVANRAISLHISNSHNIPLKKPMACVIAAYSYKFLNIYYPNVKEFDTKDMYICLSDGSTIEVFCFVPCGHCAICNSSKVQEYTFRSAVESKNSLTPPLFVTLTYDDASLPVDHSLHKEHIQRFIKRLRKNLSLLSLPDDRFTYSYCGEYGEDYTHRPHYHIVIYNLPCLTDISDEVKRNCKKFKQVFEQDYARFIYRCWSYRVSIDHYNIIPHYKRVFVKSRISSKYDQYRRVYGRVQVKCARTLGAKYMTKYCLKQQNTNYVYTPIDDSNINKAIHQLRFDISKQIYKNHNGNLVKSDSLRLSMSPEIIAFVKKNYCYLKLPYKARKVLPTKPVFKPFYRCSQGFGMSGIDVNELRQFPTSNKLSVSERWTGVHMDYYISPYYKRHIYPSYGQTTNNALSVFKKYSYLLNYLLCIGYEVPHCLLHLHDDITTVINPYKESVINIYDTSYYQYSRRMIIKHITNDLQNEKRLFLVVRKMYAYLARHFENFQEEGQRFFEINELHNNYVRLQSILNPKVFDNVTEALKYEHSADKYVNDSINNHQNIKL